MNKPSGHFFTYDQNKEYEKTLKGGIQHWHYYTKVIILSNMFKVMKKKIHRK